MNNRMKDTNDNFIRTAIDSLLKKVKLSGHYIAALSIILAVLAVIVFFDVITKNTVVSYALDEYQVGQIADRTIIAEKTLVSDAVPVLTINRGDKIINKGFPITDEQYRSLKILAETPSYFDYSSFISTFLFILLLAALSVALFSKTATGRKIELREVIFLGSIFVISYFITVLSGKTSVPLPPFLQAAFIPAAFFSILIVVLFGLKTALAFSFVLALGMFSASSFSPPLTMTVLFSSFFAAFISRRLVRRMDLVFVSLALMLFQAVLFIVLSLVFPRAVSPYLPCLPAVATNGFFSGIIALGFLTPLEMLLNTASVFRLMDLSDLNSPIMKRMLLTASGTYNHSMMVATLAESACGAIGANPLLARVGAYYHDLGKIEQPEYFVENQSGDNKHDDINPRLSVSVIRRHVKKGLEKARQLRLPQEVMNIISEHHGNGLISYFYNEAKKIDDQVSPEEFSYIGEPPSSRESAVVMLADTVEAACRTLEKPSVPRLEKFIRQLVMNKYEHHQLDKSNLTFSELDAIQQVFVSILAGYYHSRIEYPNQKDPDTDEEKKEN